MTEAAEGVRYYPIYLSLAGETCLVAGGGPGVEPVVREALLCDARVVVVAPELTSTLRAWVEAGEIEWQARAATPADAAGALLMVAATGEPALDAALVAAADALGRPVTRLDDPRLGNSLLPPNFRQGDLTIAVSTSGVWPALEERLLDEVRGDFGPEWATFLTWLGEKRAEVKARHPSIVCRIRLWDDVVATDVLPLIRAGRLQAARDLYEQFLLDWTPDATVPITRDCCRRAEPGPS